jgi:hypothetical protein
MTPIEVIIVRGGKAGRPVFCAQWLNTKTTQAEQLAEKVPLIVIPNEVRNPSLV